MGGWVNYQKGRGLELKSDYIRSRLQTLREAKRPLKVFGAESHGFQIHPPLSAIVLRDFEELHHVRLPADYRDFLLHVGNGGAGPAYGLFKFGEMDEAFRHRSWKERDGFVGTLGEPFPHNAAWNDRSGEPEFDVSRENEPQWEEEYQRQLDAWEQVYWNPANVNGAIPICHLGCAIRQWLVVNGPEAGYVWDDDRANLGGLKPLQQNARARVTFGQWYGDWLDNAMRQLHS